MCQFSNFFRQPDFRSRIFGVLACAAVFCGCLLGGQPSRADDVPVPAALDPMTTQQMLDPMPLSSRDINELFAPYAMHSSSLKEFIFGRVGYFEPMRFWLQNWTSPEQHIAWNVSSPTAADYDVVFLVNCSLGKQIRVVGPQNTLLFTAAADGWNRLKAPGVLHLPLGTSTIRLELADPNPTSMTESTRLLISSYSHAVMLKAIELTNVKAESSLAKRIAALKGDPSWMKTAGYGIMVQTGEWAYPPHGPKKPWPGFANDFDAKAFVDKVDAMGGKFLIWSGTWSSYYFPAPIKAIYDILPGRTSKRDLIGDLITECHKHNIRFMLYYNNSHGAKEIMQAKGWGEDPKESAGSRRRWHQTEAKIFREIGERYGKGLDGCFLDDSATWYPADFEMLETALKAGNPKRVICWNPWLGPSASPFQDFYGGESFNGTNSSFPSILPNGEIKTGSFVGETPWPSSNGVYTSGPHQGLQVFGCFTFDGGDWGIHQPDFVIPGPIGWTVDKIVALDQKAEKDHFPVAINLLAYEDGSVSPASFDMLQKAAQILHRGKWAEKSGKE